MYFRWIGRSFAPRSPDDSIPSAFCPGASLPQRPIRGALGSEPDQTTPVSATYPESFFTRLSGTPLPTRWPSIGRVHELDSRSCGVRMVVDRYQWKHCFIRPWYTSWGSCPPYRAPYLGSFRTAESWLSSTRESSLPEMESTWSDDERTF